MTRDRSVGNTWARVCLKDGRCLLVTKGLQAVEVSQVSPLPAPQEYVWQRDYPAGHPLEVAYRRIVMLLTAGRSIAQVTAHENLPETLRGNRVAAIAADLCYAVMGTALAAVQTLQKDPLHAGSLGSDLNTFTRAGVEAAFEWMAFLTHAIGRAAVAALAPAARDELIPALAEAMIAGFTRALCGRRIDVVEYEVMVDRLATRLADREAEYDGCPGADRPRGGPDRRLLWEVGTRMAALLGRTNEIAFIDATDDQMTACLEGLNLGARLLPLREPESGAAQAVAARRPALRAVRSRADAPHLRRAGSSTRKERRR